MTRYSIIYRDQDSITRCILCSENEIGRGLAGYRDQPTPSGEVCPQCLMGQDPVLGMVLSSLRIFHELGVYQATCIPDEIQLMAFALVSLRHYRDCADQHWTLNEERVSMLALLNEEIYRLEKRYGPLWKMPELPPEERQGMAYLAWEVRSLEAKHVGNLIHALERQP